MSCARTSKKAVSAFYFDRPKPARVRLRLVREELVAAGS